MSPELQALLRQVEAVEAKDVETGRALRMLVDYLAAQENAVQQNTKGGKSSGN